MGFVRQDAEVTPHYFQDDGMVPNSSFPLLVYQGVIDASGNDPVCVFEQMFAANHWSRTWRNGIYPFHHYHGTAHEVLGIAKGTANVCMGGEQGARFKVGPGDVMVVPAGVGHKNLGASVDLLVVGGYPDGQSPDLCKESAGEHHLALKNIPRVPMPASDPVYGIDGPVINLWK